jgi:transposase-like protein
MNNEKSTTKRKRYDEAFKRAAVEYWADSRKSGKPVAAELGVNAQSLMQWKQR